MVSTHEEVRSVRVYKLHLQLTVFEFDMEVLIKNFLQSIVFEDLHDGILLQKVRKLAFSRLDISLPLLLVNCEQEAALLFSDGIHRHNLDAHKSLCTFAYKNLRSYGNRNFDHTLFVQLALLLR